MKRGLVSTSAQDSTDLPLTDIQPLCYIRLGEREEHP